LRDEPPAVPPQNEAPSGGGGCACRYRLEGQALADCAGVKSALDAVPLPVFIADFDVRLLFANRAGRLLVGDAAAIELRRAGDVVGCVHASETPDGCGGSPSCRRCVLRNAVSRAIFQGAVHRVRAHLEVFRDGAKQERYFLVSASPFEHEGRKLAVLALEDTSKIVACAA
jgi:hypothetical protein